MNLWPFGKYKGWVREQVPVQYLLWVTTKRAICDRYPREYLFAVQRAQIHLRHLELGMTRLRLVHNAPPRQLTENDVIAMGML